MYLFILPSLIKISITHLLLNYNKHDKFNKMPFKAIVLSLAAITFG